MKKELLNRKGFTLLEVLVAAIILALVMAGMVNVFIVGKRFIVHSRSRMSGGELGKLFLAPLQGDVRADTWGVGSNSLRLGTRYCDSNPAHAEEQQPDCPTLVARTLDNIVYSAEYNITNVTVRTEPDNIRRVVATISWNESTP